MKSVRKRAIPIITWVGGVDCSESARLTKSSTIEIRRKLVRSSNKEGASEMHREQQQELHRKRDFLIRRRVPDRQVDEGNSRCRRAGRAVVRRLFGGDGSRRRAGRSGVTAAVRRGGRLLRRPRPLAPTRGCADSNISATAAKSDSFFILPPSMKGGAPAQGATRRRPIRFQYFFNLSLCRFRKSSPRSDGILPSDPPPVEFDSAPVRGLFPVLPVQEAENHGPEIPLFRKPGTRRDDSPLPT